MGSKLSSWLREEFRTDTLAPSVLAGVIIGATMVLWSVTVAALIFTGALEPFVARATGFVLVGSMFLALVMALTSSYPATIGASDEAAAAILSLIAAAIAARLHGAADGDVVFATVVAVVVISTVLSGIVFLALGAFKLGDLVRFIPHPVVGGVVVTMGWLLMAGAFGVMVDRDITLEALPYLAQPEVMWKWIPGVVFAVSLLAAMRRSSHYLVLPAMFFGAIALFYAVVFLLGVPLAQLKDDGWFLGPFPDESLWQPIDPAMLFSIDWMLVVEQIPDIGGLILLVVLGLLMSATGLELAVRRDMDLNRELRSAGFANILAGLTGGVTGSHSVEDSLLANEMGAPYRLVGVVTAAVCGLALLLGVSVLSYLPKLLLGGLILFFGLILLFEWIVEAWFNLPKTDYAIIVLCLLVSATVGYLQGIGVGIIAGIVIFVVNYSRIDVVKHALSGTNYHSNVERDQESRQLLNELGDRILVLRLQGFIFFGTAHTILTSIQGRVNADGRPRLSYVLLDFRAVDDVDTSTVSSFVRMKQLAEQNEFDILLSNVTPEVHAQLARGGMIGENGDGIMLFVDADRGLEWCENELLTSAGLHPHFEPLVQRFQKSFTEPAALADLITYLQAHTIAKGEYLVRQGDPSTDLYFVESGRVAIQLEVPGQQPVRLRSMGSGTVVGEVAFYLGLPRSASVVAEARSTVYVLTLDALTALKQDNPGLAAALHEFLVRVLAGRLAETNKLLSAVLD